MGDHVADPLGKVERAEVERDRVVGRCHGERVGLVEVPEELGEEERVPAGLAVERVRERRGHRLLGEAGE